MLFKVATEVELSEITSEVSIFVGQFLKVKKSNEVSIMFKKLPVGTFSSSVAKISELVTCSSWFSIVFSCPSKLKYECCVKFIMVSFVVFAV